MLKTVSLLRFLVFLLSSKAGNPSSHPFSPHTNRHIAALDQYGSCPQIQNAKLASTRHGNLVVSAISKKDGAAVVCSLLRKRPGVRINQERKMGVVNLVSFTDDSALGFGIDDSGTTSTSLAVTGVVCSGLAVDSSLLTRVIRRKCAELWERYGLGVQVGCVSNAVSDAFLSFMRYDRNSEVMDGTGPLRDDEDDNDNEEDGIEMSRPFGLRVLVVGVTGGPSLSSVRLRSVDPSGVQCDCVAQALGNGAERANDLLRTRWKEEMTTNDIEELCIAIIREVCSDSAMGELIEAKVVCETLTSHGLRAKTFCP